MDSQNCEHKRHLSIQRHVYRLRKNRVFAKESRERSKAKLEMLETQMKQLSEEAMRLRMEIQTTQPATIANDYQDALDAFMTEVAKKATDQRITDEEISAFIDKAKETTLEVGGVRHRETVQEVFKRTVEMMIPEHVILMLLFSEEGALPELKSLLQSSLTPEMWEEHERILSSCREQKPLLKSAIDDLQAVVDEICGHSQVLHSLLTRIRPILGGRQCAHFALWLHKNYKHLMSEKVLNEGHNSMELLNPR